MSVWAKIAELNVGGGRPHVWCHSGADDCWRCWHCGVVYRPSPWIERQVCRWEYQPKHAVMTGNGPADRVQSG